jgi:hypothetical protein
MNSIRRFARWEDSSSLDEYVELMSAFPEHLNFEFSIEGVRVTLGNYLIAYENF